MEVCLVVCGWPCEPPCQTVRTSYVAWVITRRSYPSLIWLFVVDGWAYHSQFCNATKTIGKEGKDEIVTWQTCGHALRVVPSSHGVLMYAHEDVEGVAAAAAAAAMVVA